MAETFKYKNLLSSAEFNSRYADILLPSVLRGFYFEKGTDDFDLTLTYGPDPSSAVIMQGGLRIQEEEILEDVIQITPNSFPHKRIDNIYAHYIYGDRLAEVTYLADEGKTDRPNELLPEDQYAFLGSVELRPGETLATATFRYPNRGIHLPDVSHSLTFKETVTFEKGAIINDGAGGENSVVTEGVMRNFVFPYAQVVSSNRDGNTDIYKTVTYLKNDGRKVFETNLLDKDAGGRFMKVKVDIYKDDGLTIAKTEHIELTYDDRDVVIDKKRL